MANSVTSQLVIKLLDDVSNPANRVSEAIGKITLEERRLAAQAKGIEAATRQLGNLGRLDGRLKRTKEGLAAEEAAVKRLAEAMGRVEQPTKKMVEALMRS